MLRGGSAALQKFSNIVRLCSTLEDFLCCFHDDGHAKRLLAFRCMINFKRASRDIHLTDHIAASLRWQIPCLLILNHVVLLDRAVNLSGDMVTCAPSDLFRICGNFILFLSWVLHCTLFKKTGMNASPTSSKCIQFTIFGPVLIRKLPLMFEILDIRRMKIYNSYAWQIWSQSRISIPIDSFCEILGILWRRRYHTGCLRAPVSTEFYFPIGLIGTVVSLH